LRGVRLWEYGGRRDLHRDEGVHSGKSLSHEGIAASASILYLVSYH
jgi:hypothetical protein